ncbi:synaptonemal complex central element protein 2 [Pempheris klunzingeri]|uniref:synaptonemal complex central element protein 2 n=1 Tax=Pempheris klunzingeri TaxID=3127111 RepID=UPI00397EB1FA
MDFFYEDLPSTSQSTKNGHEDSHMTEDTDRDSSRQKSSSVSVTETQERYTSSSIDDISRRVQDLVEKINDSRTSDQKVMDSFQEKLVQKVTEMYQQMKEHMYTVYEENSNEMQVKLQELAEVLESCTKLHKELMDANRALAGLREGLAISQTSEP